ncbi:hypothetical protein HUW63_14150 [Myxococcus sp. AM001]|nr:hypothetical protein [Myxococcus sp. AM001]
MSQFIGALGEIFSADHRPNASLRHLMESTGSLIGASALWWSIVGDPPQSRHNAAIITHSYVHGVDERALLRWQRAYLVESGYRQHPMWGPFARNAGRLRSACREELVSDQEWYSHPHVAEWGRGMGYDDILVSAVPLGAGASAYLVATRPWGDRRFGERERERELLELLFRSASWCYRSWLEPQHDTQGGLRLDGVRSHLPPRHRAILEQLLTGRSEKQIAASTGLSLRTTHKYIEYVYRAFAVSSRAELMALWVR